LGKEHESGACQSALSRFENNILATGKGLKALEDRSADLPTPSFDAEINGGSSSM
jgi:hypothetical protein